MWLPKFMYRYKPHLLIAIGVFCLVTFDNNLPGDVAGWLLIAAGTLIYWVRHR